MKFKKIYRRILPKSFRLAFRAPYKKILQFFKQINPKKQSLRFARYYKKYDVNDKTILYESYGGQGMLCNPYAIFKVLIDNKEFSNFHHVWTVNEDSEIRYLRKRYKENKNISFVKRGDKKNIKAMVTAKYLVNNSAFPGYFSKKAEQIYINTWHSITIKTLGFDSPFGRFTDSNVIRNVLMSDYLLCANNFMTGIFKNSYKLDGFYVGRIIQEGYPRNDLLIKATKNEIISELLCRKIKVDTNKKIILYAPTWKGVSFVETGKESNQYQKVVDTLLKNIESDDYQILIKPHYGVYRNLPPEEKASGKYIPSYIDTNELLSIVDILITDYSSIAFDYLHTERPILFYIPDIEEYKNYRGVYFKPDELPGPSSNDILEIAKHVNNIDETYQNYKEKYMEYKSWVCKHDDGYSAERIVDCVFRKSINKYNVSINKYNVLDISKTKKKKILIYGSVLLTNGVTSTLIDRLNNIDYEKFDVSLIVFDRPNKQKNNENVININQNVRVLCRVQTYAATLKEHYNAQYIIKHGLFSKKLQNKCPHALFQRDFYRSLGDSKFDYVLDYSGYSLYYPLLLTKAKGAKRIIWQHNDLHSDLNNLDKSQQKSYKKHMENTMATISVYPLYDKIIAVGKSAMEENRKHFATDTTRSRFSYINNLIDDKPILEKAGRAQILEWKGKKYFIDNADELGVDGCFNKNFIPFPEDNAINFVTMGRLSSEKNHLSLIDAFAMFLEEYPKSRLYIIGNGDLKAEMLQKIVDRDLQSRVILTGRLSNPFGLMKHCSCFILPSLYEGLCTAVLEARILKMPIIMSNFNTAKDLCVENGQIITDMTVAGIYKGMKQFAENPVMKYDFNIDEHNRQSAEAFEALFDL